MVPPGSADPGHGAFSVVEGSDHVDVCKPASREDPRYTELVAFLASVLGGGGDGADDDDQQQQSS